MNVARLGELNLERFGEYENLVFGDQVFTNVQILDGAARFASVLRGLGVGPGDRVGVLLPNLPAVGITYSGIFRSGGVAVPMLFLLAEPEIRHIVSDCGAKVLVTSPEFLPKVRAAVAGLDPEPVLLVTGGAAADGALGFEGLLEAEQSRAPLVDRQPSDLAVISYTSGTTGHPKGVMLSHGNLVFNAENTARCVDTRDGDVSVVVLPLAHLYGMGSTLVGQLFRLKGILLQWFTAEGFFDAVSRHRARHASMVPTMVQYMLTHPQFDEVDWSSFDWCIVGAAPLPSETAAEFEKRTGARVLEGYGLTETSPTATLTRIDDDRRPGSCGRPVPHVEIAVMDDDDTPLPPREQGEVCIKGPNVMLGYYGMPDATEDVIRDGWFHSGDVGYLDEDGFLYITDRKKDMIIRGGLNIYPRDVEEVLHTHPAVMESAVVGVPDPALGEEVKAFVVLKAGAAAGADELLEHCRARLAKYKAPKQIEFLDVLPRNMVGKVLKRELRARATAGGEG